MYSLLFFNKTKKTLFVKLHFLASGVDQPTLIFIFCIAKSTNSKIISKTTELYTPLWKKNIYETIRYQNRVIVPTLLKKCGICLHCIGALDGNYIKIECPSLGGPLYHKYKGKFGIVLVNMCDIYCLFTWFRSNQYEKQK